MRAWIREEFTAGGWRWYMAAGVPMATLIAALTPPAFDPFVVATFLFPLFFWFIRRGRLAAALWSGLGWLTAHALLVAFLVGWDRPVYLPAFTGPADFGWNGAPATDYGALIDAAGKGMADFIFTLALAGISGGALPLVAAVSLANDTGVAVGGLFATFGGGGTMEAAFLSVRPWGVFSFVGSLMGAIAMARWFALKLEGRPVDPTPLIRYGILGFSLVAFALYLQYLLGPSWETAYGSALSSLSSL